MLIINFTAGLTRTPFKSRLASRLTVHFEIGNLEENYLTWLEDAEARGLLRFPDGAKSGNAFATRQ